MKLVQELWTARGSTRLRGSESALTDAQLVLGFGAPQLLADQGVWQRLREQWGAATILMCSTAGEISGAQVLDDSLALTAMSFDHTPIRCAEVVLSEGLTSADAGRQLAEQLMAPDLTHVFVLSDGLKVNGSELVSGMTATLPGGVSLT